MKVKIGDAAKEFGVSIETLRRWEASGKIEVERTPNGHRRFDLAKLRQIIPRKASHSSRLTLAYARVSTNEQKEDLKRQILMLESFCSTNGWTYELLQDFGSGLNYKKRGLNQLIKRICSGEIGRLVLTHKDRLLRLGAELIFSICEHFSCEVVIINTSSANVSFEEELTKDVLEIITVFSARLYGARSRKNKEIMQKLKEAANEISS